MNSLMTLFRADASSRTGSGHIMRCLALAQACQDAGGETRFATAEIASALEWRVGTITGHAPLRVSGAAGSDMDASETIALAKASEAAWVVLDGYCFGGDFQTAIKSARRQVLAVDDYGHAEHYSADLVLNQNLHATDALYQNRERFTELLLGTRFALLRREFQSWRKWNRNCNGNGRNVLVTLGGADPDNVTTRVVRELRSAGLRHLRIEVVLGGANLHRQSILDEAAKAEGSIHVQESVTDMGPLMAWADVAISAAGSTCWELAFMGLPAILISLAENQIPIGSSLDKAGAATYIGDATSTAPGAIATCLCEMIASSELRSRMSLVGRALVDGQGADRVASALRSRVPEPLFQHQDSRLN
jgi:UDP-2,4-diacetamido-2,4,6-trideoxy-beta-L-altropyranose hydrolase